MRFKVIMPILLVFIVVLCGCSAQAQTEEINNRFKVGIVFTAEHLGDQGLNDTAMNGLVKARDELDAVFTYQQIEDDTDYNQAIDALAAEGAEMIITLEDEASSSIERAAADYPEIHFVAMNSSLDNDAVTSIVFPREELAFLAGAAAATITHSGKIGYSAAPDEDRSYVEAYQAGAELIDNGVEVIEIQAADKTASGGKQAAGDLIRVEADVLYSIEPALNKAMMETAALQDVYGIGVNEDLSYLAPEAVVTSAIIKTDQAIQSLIEKSISGDAIETGAAVYGTAEGAIGTAPVRIVSITDKVTANLEKAANALHN